MDYGHIIIHVFYESTRSFYNLEGLWSDARRMQTDSMRQQVDSPIQNGDEEVDETVFIE